MKKIFQVIAVVGSISSIVGLMLYFYPQQEPDTKGQSNKINIKNLQSTELHQSNNSNNFKSNKQDNEVLLDSAVNAKIKQENK